MAVQKENEKEPMGTSVDRGWSLLAPSGAIRFMWQVCTTVRMGTPCNGNNIDKRVDRLSQLLVQLPKDSRPHKPNAHPLLNPPLHPLPSSTTGAHPVAPREAQAPIQTPQQITEASLATLAGKVAFVAEFHARMYWGRISSCDLNQAYFLENQGFSAKQAFNAIYQARLSWIQKGLLFLFDLLKIPSLIDRTTKGYFDFLLNEFRTKIIDGELLKDPRRVEEVIAYFNQFLDAYEEGTQRFLEKTPPAQGARAGWTLLNYRMFAIQRWFEGEQGTPSYQPLEQLSSDFISHLLTHHSPHIQYFSSKKLNSLLNRFVRWLIGSILPSILSSSIRNLTNSSGDLPNAKSMTDTLTHLLNTLTEKLQSNTSPSKDLSDETPPSPDLLTLIHKLFSIVNNAPYRTEEEMKPHGKETVDWIDGPIQQRVEIQIAMALQGFFKTFKDPKFLEQMATNLLRTGALSFAPQEPIAPGAYEASSKALAEAARRLAEALSRQAADTICRLQEPLHRAELIDQLFDIWKNTFKTLTEDLPDLNVTDVNSTRDFVSLLQSKVEYFLSQISNPLWGQILSAEELASAQTPWGTSLSQLEETLKLLLQIIEEAKKQEANQEAQKLYQKLNNAFTPLSKKIRKQQVPTQAEVDTIQSHFNDLVRFFPQGLPGIADWQNIQGFIEQARPIDQILNSINELRNTFIEYARASIENDFSTKRYRLKAIQEALKDIQTLFPNDDTKEPIQKIQDAVDRLGSIPISQKDLDQTIQELRFALEQIQFTATQSIQTIFAPLLERTSPRGRTPLGLFHESFAKSTEALDPFIQAAQGRITEYWNRTENTFRDIKESLPEKKPFPMTHWSPSHWKAAGSVAGLGFGSFATLALPLPAAAAVLATSGTLVGHTSRIAANRTSSALRAAGLYGLAAGASAAVVGFCAAPAWVLPFALIGGATTMGALTHRTVSTGIANGAEERIVDLVDKLPHFARQIPLVELAMRFLMRKVVEAK